MNQLVRDVVNISMTAIADANIVVKRYFVTVALEEKLLLAVENFC
jgi:hypothetical protein